MFIRNCPKCGCLIEYKTKHGFTNAKSNDSKCADCSRKYKKITDEAGNTYGKLRIIKRVSNNKQGIWYECLCDCGNTVNRLISSLKANEKKNIISCCNECFGLPKGESAFNVYYLSYKKGAIKRNIEYILSEEDFRDIIFKECYYCGEPATRPIYTFMKGGLRVNGVDRVDNTKGYNKENCVSCCYKCNYAKNTHSKEDFLNWIKRVYEYNFSRNSQRVKTW